MSRRKRSEDSEGGSAPAWITTYSDLMSLLLCFFIMLFAFSTVDAAKFKEALVSLQGALGVLSSGRALFNPDEMPLPPDIPSQLGDDENRSNDLLPEDLLRLKESLEGYLDGVGLSDKVMLEVNRRGLLIRFTDTVLFDLGRADLRQDSVMLLRDIGGFIGPISNEVMVEGHTDNIPLRHEAHFATNWELSTARATTVVRHFIEALDMSPIRFSAAGYGEYRPVVPNTTDANRSMNRRVDIVIVAGDESSIPQV